MCVICEHTSVADIDQQLRNGVPLQRVEKQYGLGHGSLYRHVAAKHHQNGSVQAVDTGEKPMDTPESDEIVFTTSAEVEAPDLGDEFDSPISFPPVELMMDTAPAEAYEPVEDVAAEPVQPARPAWRDWPLFSGMFVDQAQRHAQLLGFPALEVGRQVIAAGESGWRQYLDGIWDRGSNMEERKMLQALLQRLEDVADAEAAGLPIPEDMSSPMLDTGQAMARNRRLGLALDNPDLRRLG